MKVYYVKLNDKDVKNLTRIEFKKLQSKIGYKIVDYVGEKVFNISDRTIIKINNKPQFQYSDIEFNISHSNKIVATAFDQFPIGIDVEFMKERDFEKLGKHYGINTSDKTEFYKKWTQLEAEIKLQAEVKQSYTKELEKEYMLTISSSSDDEILPEITEITEAVPEI